MSPLFPNPATVSAVTEVVMAKSDTSRVLRTSSYSTNAISSNAPPKTPHAGNVPAVDPHHQPVSNENPQDHPSKAFPAPQTSPRLPLSKRTWTTEKTIQKYKVGYKLSSNRLKSASNDKSKWPLLLNKAKRIYQYTRIPSHEVRLLYIKPGAFDDIISASLLVLDDRDLGTEDFPYVALSYNWGDDEDTSTIVIQDDPRSRPIKSEEFTDLAAVVTAAVANASKEKIFSIKPNLHEALKRLRDEREATAVWVDAICINQRDPTEKKEQVAKMDKIYRKAYNVNIWLGSDDDPQHPVSDMAMTFIQEVIEPDKHSELVNDDKYTKYWASLFELLRWRWFSRKWIIQELALAQNATVHCGKHKCSWNNFQIAISIFRQKFNILKPKLISYFEASSFRHGTWYDDSVFEIEQLGASILVEMTSTLFRKRRNGSLESTKGLEDLVCLLSGFDTSDPRDTINAVRNIAKELNRPDSELARTVPVPDYGKDLFEVYRDFVKWVIENSKSVDILCRQWALKESKTRTPTTPRLVDLPSWIQFVEDSAWGKGEDVFNGRKAGDSFVGLPENNTYHASGSGASRKEPVVEFPRSTEPIRGVPSSVNFAGPPSDFHHDMSLIVRGVTIGKISFRTGTFPDGVITKDCLHSLGWCSDEESESIGAVPDQLWQTLVADRDLDGKRLQQLDEVACKHALKQLTQNGHLNIEKILRRKPYPGDDMVRRYLERVRAVTWDRSCIEGIPTTVTASQNSDQTMERLVGFAPSKVGIGDVIAILYGCSVPVILRPLVDNERAVVAYDFLGEAYIYGMMEGEAFEEDFPEQDFKLI